MYNQNGFVYITAKAKTISFPDGLKINVYIKEADFLSLSVNESDH